MEAFVTLATTDEYAVGALVWARSLRAVKTTKKLACLITENLSAQIKSAIEQVFDCIQIVNVMDSKDTYNLALLSRPDLGVTFTKLHCWRLTQYSKCVFMDADTLVFSNIDDLFTREELSASPDPGWPDCFNSGVFVFKPSLETYAKLVDHALVCGSFDGGDQGLLNTFFQTWTTDLSRRLPVTDNCMSVSFYSYLPAFLQHKQHIRVAHFIGAIKPWHQKFDTRTGSVIPRDENTKFTVDFLNKWWRIFMHEVVPLIDPSVLSKCMPSLDVGFVGEMVKLPVPTHGPISGESSELASVQQQVESSSVERQMAWERGEIDYTGTDRFDKIASKLDSVLSGNQ